MAGKAVKLSRTSLRSGLDLVSPGPRQTRAGVTARLAKNVALDLVVGFLSGKQLSVPDLSGKKRAHPGAPDASAMEGALQEKAEAQSAAAEVQAKYEDLGTLCLEMRSELEALRSEVYECKIAVLRWRGAAVTALAAHDRGCDCLGCAAISGVLTDERAATEEKERSDVEEAEAERPAPRGRPSGPHGPRRGVRSDR